MINRISLLASFMFMMILVYGQNVSFYAEDLNFSLNASTFEVDGLYYFRNHTEKEVKQMLFYPFPDIEKYGEITFIRIHIQGDTTSMLSTKSSKGSLFKLKVPPNGEAVYCISYGQKMKSKEAKYIITTTQKWNEPFEFAKYTLTFPENLMMDSVSILPDTTGFIENKILYRWQMENFMPTVDFVFRFSRK